MFTYDFGRFGASIWSIWSLLELHFDYKWLCKATKNGGGKSPLAIFFDHRRPSRELDFLQVRLSSFFTLIISQAHAFVY